MVDRKREPQDIVCTGVKRIPLKVYIGLMVFALVAGSIGLVLAKDDGPGPAPNSGDCIPDGSGLDSPQGANANGDIGNGPAPNSGDGIPDGSGIESPNGPNN